MLPGRYKMRKNLKFAASVIILLLILCAPLISKNSNAPVKEEKPAVENQAVEAPPAPAPVVKDEAAPALNKPENAMAFPTPYNSALQDFKFEFSILIKSDAVSLVIYTSDKIEIKRIELGPMDPGKYIKVFDRAEFAGIPSGTYYYRIIFTLDNQAETTDYTLMYILK
jgi:hypothetical protein